MDDPHTERQPRRRFDGEILAFGTSSGTRVVVGRWVRSPFGAFADVMVERGDGHRVLVAPPEVADFVAETYRFDEVVRTAVSAVVVGTEIGGEGSDGVAHLAHPAHLVLRAGPLAADVWTGGRTAYGRVLRLVPRALATSADFARVTDPVARLALRGVRTRGSAGAGRHESYGATDSHAIVAVEASWDGEALGALRDVAPPVRFGFGSSPPRPTATRLVTTVVG
ncbi:hypothetical protein GCM10025865_18440 [Paraoerskovia sediminicola]|uniref:Uncharacterized protein n=1 Tax=Paraoerskovia sediminicola TaxID=1138587 RepID=A0ABM8G324_9CELL|nr:hypothetical protein [Paraoerskovia sediminicola]BDZ42545.1 hypothetical protein GCM10025865_18440 [Paraoerskovia sediminicola]